MVSSISFMTDGVMNEDSQKKKKSIQCYDFIYIHTYYEMRAIIKLINISVSLSIYLFHMCENT